MSTSSLMSLGKQAVFAAYAQLQTTSNNIANANTPGYSRQSAQLATAGSSYSGSGYFGRGVTVASVTRASNMFLTQQAVATGSAAAADNVRSGLLAQLEKVLPGGAAGLGNAATQIFNAFADLAAAPADLAARQAVLGRLEDFASLARSSSNQIEVLQAHVAQDVAGGVQQVNTLAKELAKLNVQIAAAANRGHQPNELLDQRDQLIARIGEQVEVHTILGPDQTASVFVGSGQTLVLGAAAHQLVAMADPLDKTRMALGVNIAGQLNPLTTEAVGEGTLGGLMRFQDRDLSEARNRLGQLVTGLAAALNQQQGFGLDLQGQPGTPLFAFSGPQALPASGNARDASGNPVATVALTITDASALKASDYRLEPDPANGGQYVVTRLADGQVFAPVPDGGSVDGFAITIGPNAPAPGESFTLKPVAAAAGSLTLAMTSARGLAAANPVTAVAEPANTGTATITALEVNAAPSAPYQALTLRFTDALGAYEIVDAANTPQATGTFTAGTPIVYDGLALSLAGQPRAGDRITLAPTSHPAASNGNALRFDSLATRGLVDGQTVADAHASTMAELGIRVQGAAASAETSATVASRAQAELSAETGVNLDEEAARLIQYQQGYQAAAKMLQTAQTMFDAILNIR